MELSIDKALQINVTWEHSLTELMKQAGFITNHWPERPYRANPQWCDYWGAGRCVRINEKSLKRKQRPNLYNSDSSDSWLCNARDFSQIEWVRKEWRIEPNPNGLPTIFDEWGDLFQEEVVVDKQVTCRTWQPKNRDELGIVDQDERTHRVGNTTTLQASAIGFGQHNPRGDVALLRYKAMQETKMRPASLYETIAYVAKYFDRHEGQVLVPCAGWSQKTYSRHTGIPMFQCSTDGVTTKWCEHNGWGWGPQARFLAVPE